MPGRDPRVAERNLLFAGLGLTLGILSRDRVIRAFTEWLLDKHRPLGDILLEQKAITPEQCAAIQTAVDQQIASEGGDTEKALATLENAKDLESDLDHLQDTDLQKSLAPTSIRTRPPVPEAGTLGNQTPPAWTQNAEPGATLIPGPGDLPPTMGRFVPQRFLDAGNLGELYIATDTEVNRTVVLKYIKDRQARNPLSRALFHLEGEVTGYLDHPSIAPVFGLGTDAFDRSYYAMRYIRGRKLTEAIKEYHAIPSRESSKRQETLTGLLQSFQAACMAVEYAHSKGVIHCDLKPDNIMVGPFGETVVVDWGLVLVQCSVQTDDGDVAGIDDLAEKQTKPETYKPSEIACRGLHEKQGGTRTFIGGTPAYIAPEQWQATSGGGVDLVTPASDIFSLGATLYHILTNRPPLLPDRANHESSDSFHARLATAQFPAPRSIDSSVPKPLEGIVLKAMTADPKIRYPSARALADDLKRYVSDEQLEGYPENAIEQSRRWFRKNRAAAGVLGMFLVCSTVAALGYGVLTSRFNTSLEEKNGVLSLREIETRKINTQLLQANKKLLESEELANQNANKAREEQLRAELQAELANERLYIGKVQRAQTEWEYGSSKVAEELLLSIPFHRRGWEHDFLWSQITGKTTTLGRYSSRINSVSFSPDGQRIVGASSDGTVEIWDATTGAEVRVLRGHSARFNSASFSPDGRCIVVASSDGTVGIWDATTGAELRVLDRHANAVSSVSFSPDGQRIVGASSEGTVGIWDATTGAEVRVLRGHSAQVNSASFSPDGRHIVSTGVDRTVRIWDVTTGVERLTLRWHKSLVYAASFSPDGRLVASASEDGTLMLCDASSGARIHTLIGHRAPVFGVSFSPDGRHIASVGLDRTLKLWDVYTKLNIKTFSIQAGAAFSPSFSRDGRRIVSAVSDGTVRIWDSTNEAVPRILSSHTKSVNLASFSPDGRRIVSAGEDGMVIVRDANTGAVIHSLKAHERVVNSALFSPDGLRIISAGETVKIWDATNGALVHKFEWRGVEVNSASFSPDGQRIVSAGDDGTVIVRNANSGVVIHALVGYGRFANSASFSSDGLRIVSAGEDGTVKIRDVITGGVIHALNGHGRSISSVSFNTSDKRIVSAGQDGTVRIWDAITGAEIRVLRGHSAWVNSASFSPDGRRIVSASIDGTIKLWDTASGSEVLTLRGPTNYVVNSAAFSPDGLHIVSANGDGSLCLWDAFDKSDSFILKGHVGQVLSASFSPDGRRIVSASVDETVRIWDAATGAELRVLRGHTARVNSASFSPDGQHVVSASDDWTARVWDAPTGAELRVLRGHKEPVNFASFSPDGRRITSKYRGGRLKLWDVSRWQELQDELAAFTVLPAMDLTTSDGLWTIELDGNDVVFASKTVRQARILRDKESLDTWAKPNPSWHEREAAEAEKAGSWFAAVFHLKRLVEIEPKNEGARKRLEEARKKMGDG